MSSHFDDPSKWRLRTAGGIPYKQLEMSGDFEFEGGSVSRTVLIPSNQLLAFLQEQLPSPVQIGNVIVPQVRTLEGFPSLALNKIKFSQFDSSLPIDPFGFDSGAPSGTYYSVVKCDIEYGPHKKIEGDENDPQTFLEVSANTTQEFLHGSVLKSKWQLETNPDLTGDDESPSGGHVDPDTDEVGDGAVNPTEGDKEVNTDPTISFSTMVPKTEWTVRWTQIPYVFFRDVLIHRMRYLLGRVNSNTVGFLFNALPETLLFAGYNYSQTVTWREGNTNTPPATVEMKFIEKRIIWNGIVCGHNHFWRPGYGWQRLLINGTDPPYKKWDMSRLFKV